MAAGGSDGLQKHHGSPGADIMLSGIVFQLSSLLVFSYLFGQFSLRARWTKGLFKSGREHKYFRLLVSVVILSAFCIITRGCYRTAELSEGWFGYLIHREDFFIGFDGSLMIVAVGVFNVFHPGWLLHRMRGH